MNDIEELLKNKRDEILRIAAKHGAYNVRVFGSVARGEADEDSDIDFLVEMGQDRGEGGVAGERVEGREDSLKDLLAQIFGRAIAS